MKWMIPLRSHLRKPQWSAVMGPLTMFHGGLAPMTVLAAKTSGAGPEMERVAEASNWPGKNLLLPKKPGGRNLPTKNKRHQFGWYPCVNFWLNPQIWVWDYMFGLLRPNFYENFKHPKHVGESGDVLEWELLLDAFWICTSSGLIPASFCCWFHHESSMMSSAAI